MIGEAKFGMAKTGVFWDVEECPIPIGLHPDQIYQSVKSSLAQKGYHGKVKIKAYKETMSDEIFDHYLDFGIKFAPGVSGGKSARVDRMILDIFSWALRTPAPSNLMLVSNNIAEESELTSVLEAFKSRDYNVLVAQPEEVPSRLDTVMWMNFSICPLNVGCPADQSGSSKKSRKRKRKRGRGSKSRRLKRSKKSQD